MIALFHIGARVPLLSILILLGGCGARSGGIKDSPPDLRSGCTCPAPEEAEFQQQIASLSQAFRSPQHGQNIALAALAITGDIPFECLESAERQWQNLERGD